VLYPDQKDSEEAETEEEGEGRTTAWTAITNEKQKWNDRDPRQWRQIRFRKGEAECRSADEAEAGGAAERYAWVSA
jgi:hypothetical protein